MSINEQIRQLNPLREQLLVAEKPEEKLALLRAYEGGKEPLKQMYEKHKGQMQNLSVNESIVLTAMCAIGQVHVFSGAVDSLHEKLQALFTTLIDIDHFYQSIGGIVGYHLTVLELIEKKAAKSDKSHSHNKERTYYRPEGMDISQDSFSVRKAILKGISMLPSIAEVYPIGGAGDRLNLHDKEGQSLPAACLSFCGKSLLNGLMRDLQAREYLYFKLYGEQLTTPVALMTSHEKNNHHRICKIAEEYEWFNRPPDSFFLCTQPLVPVITKEGKWVISKPYTLLLKPGGHGVIWKKAKETGVIDALLDRKRSKILVRQVNNPIAGIDHTLLAFTGEGFLHDYTFGFMSCPRFVNASEGTLVLLEKHNPKGGYDYCISNIEYTEFDSCGIADVPAKPDSPYSAFPANTNILFVDLKGLLQAMQYCEIPGMLINMKNKYASISTSGAPVEIEGGRLEATMQNISDWIIDNFATPLPKEKFQSLSSFVVYNDREKTIASTKASFSPGKSPIDTPEGTFYVFMQNAHNLLKQCGFQLPPLNGLEDYLKEGPSLIFLYHPALGPLYSIISQKLQGGKLGNNTELQLEIADVHIVDLSLQGSLIVEAEAVMGDLEETAVLRYSCLTGKCQLKHVTIENLGMDRDKTYDYWKNAPIRKEAMTIRLKGNAEFIAENVTFKGEYFIEVPDGYCMTAYQEGSTVRFTSKKIERPSWYWEYSSDEEARIMISKKDFYEDS